MLTEIFVSYNKTVETLALKVTVMHTSQPRDPVIAATAFFH
jgi:hypothetical protein